MQIAGSVRLRALVLVLVALASLAPAQARDPVPLRGWYQLTEERTEAGHTALRLHLMLFNLAESALENVKLELTSNVDPGRRLASLPQISIPAFDRREVEVEVSLTARDFEAWRLGAKPRVHLVDNAADGAQWRRRIDLEPRSFVDTPVEGSGGGAVEIQRGRIDEGARP